MRPLLWVLVSVLIVAVLAGPILYLSFASTLPDLRTSDEVLGVVKRAIEDERMRVHSAMKQGRVDKYELLPFAAINKAYLAVVLTDAGCPRFLAEPREDDGEFAQRVLWRTINGNMGPRGSGQCELRLTEPLAGWARCDRGIRRGIATHRIRKALSKEEMVRHAVAGAYYAHGVIGAPYASRELLHRDFSSLDLAQSIELFMAEYDYRLIRECRNAAQIRLIRDQMLDAMSSAHTASEADVRRTRAAPIACMKVP